MKICIIGHPRSRSSLLLEILRSYYEIPIIGEELNNLGNLSYRFERYDGEERAVPNLYKIMLSGILKNINCIDDGVIRIHPTQLSYLLYSSKVIDFDLLELTQYDKIYFTVRKNIPNLIGSLFVAHKLNKFTYQDKQEVCKVVGPFMLEPDLYFQAIEMLLYSEFIMDKVKEYLSSHSIEWEELDYDDVPRHVELNYSNASTSHVETEYDYQNIITNYSELQTIYEHLKPIVYKRFMNDNTVDK